ncbi:hypothetical protein WICPIJ_009327 [Wickerhamomyces pijperi]|uniref:Uncharacterized protein n=1 Tax=Wickerhamomyces pijperi TaxID=599730 RepID=A0A9P8PQ67_WICPI|nr:hypothetical protein WICPIJ_009327 [Wickerhamomyces pijperi]
MTVQSVPPPPLIEIPITPFTTEIWTNIIRQVDNYATLEQLSQISYFKPLLNANVAVLMIHGEEQIPGSNWQTNLQIPQRITNSVQYARFPKEWWSVGHPAKININGLTQLLKKFSFLVVELHSAKVSNKQEVDILVSLLKAMRILVPPNEPGSFFADLRNINNVHIRMVISERSWSQDEYGMGEGQYNQFLFNNFQNLIPSPEGYKYDNSTKTVKVDTIGLNSMQLIQYLKQQRSSTTSPFHPSIEVVFPQRPPSHLKSKISGYMLPEIITSFRLSLRKSYHGCLVSQMEHIIQHIPQEMIDQLIYSDPNKANLITAILSKNKRIARKYINENLQQFEISTALKQGKKKKSDNLPTPPQLLLNNLQCEPIIAELYKFMRFCSVQCKDIREVRFTLTDSNRDYYNMILAKSVKKFTNANEKQYIKSKKKKCAGKRTGKISK